jgi:hypothetical protein
MTKIIIVMTILGVMGFVGTFDADEEARQQARYCEMVELHKQTAGEHGWPAYKGLEECKND